MGNISQSIYHYAFIKTLNLSILKYTKKALNLTTNHLFKGNKPRYILFVAYHLNENYKPSKIKMGEYHLPAFPIPSHLPNSNPDDYLRGLCKEGLKNKYENISPDI